MELDFSIGTSNKNKIKAGFDFSKSEVNSRVMVKFQQIYYTMTYDAKARPADYFQEGVTSQEVYNTINGTSVAPVYVSNVKYGRLAFYNFESEMTQQELTATLNAAFSYLKVNSTLDASLKTQFANKKTKISGTIIGGSGNSAVQSITDIDGLYQYITQGGNFSATSPGLPIAYTLRRITDNGVFNVVNLSEYVVNECYNTTGSIKLNTLKHVDGSQSDNLKGDIRVNLGYDGESFANSASILWIQRDGFFNLPIGGQAMWPSGSELYNISYDPSKFDKAYIEIYINFTNRYSWSKIGKDNHKGNTDANFSNSYRLYLKDFKSGKLGANWAINSSASNTKTYDLNIYMPGKYATNNACVDKNWVNACTKRKDIDVSKAETRVFFNFSIDVQTIGK